MRQLYRSPTLLLLCALWLSSCAALGPTVEISPPNDAASQPASAPTLSELDFTPIPPGACDPPFNAGIFVSLDGANALVYAQRRMVHEHRLQLLERDEKIALAESRASGAEKQVAEADSWWGRYKFWIGLGAGALLTGGAFVGGAYLFKR